jgi:hypothetical protein
MTPPEDNKQEIQKVISPKIEPMDAREPKSKVQEIFSQLEMMALHKSSSNGLDFSKFDKEQLDKVLDTLHLNEQNAYNYHTRRLDAHKEIEIEKIKASVVNETTNRHTIYIAGAVFLIITVLILIFKDTFFVSWITFITGLAGGFGVGKYSNKTVSEAKASPAIQEDSE